MSTENMRKLIMLAEGLDEDYRDDPNRPGWKDEEGNWNKYEDCPTCHGWGEIAPTGNSMGIDFDEIIPCPDCGPEDGPAAQGKSKIIKQMANDLDMDYTDLPLSEAFTRKHFRMIADTVSQFEDPEHRRATAELYADTFAEDNPRFRRDLFMKACGVEELEEGPGDDAEWDAHWAREDGDDERADDLEADAEWARMDDVDESPEFIDDKLRSGEIDADDVDYDWEENELTEETSEFRLAEIIGKDGLAALLADLRSGGIDYSGTYFEPLYFHFLDEYPDEIPVGSRTGRPEDPEEYVLDNLERYHSEEIKSYMNTPDMDENNCGVCGETFKWEGNPDDEMCPRCTQEYLGEDGDSDKGKPYICVHVKKGKHECYADTSYGAAKKAAEHWGLKSTAGIDAHLAIDEASCPCGKDGCECGPDCDCEPVKEGANDNWGVGDYVVPTWELYGDSSGWDVPLEVIGVKGDQVWVQDDYGNKELMFPEDLRKAPEAPELFPGTMDALNKLSVKENPEVKGVNDKYDDKLNCKHCGSYYCTSKFGGECPEIQMDMFGDIELDEIVESVLDERSAPKDYEMSDDELAAEIEDETSEFERDSIDPEIEDEELGLRFD
jgi:rubrerythrin